MGKLPINMELGYVYAHGQDELQQNHHDTWILLGPKNHPAPVGNSKVFSTPKITYILLFARNKWPQSLGGM